MINVDKIENLGFEHMGSRWFKNESDTVRIRQWKDDEIDIYKWYDNDDNQIHFRGKLYNTEELEWVLDRIF